MKLVRERGQLRQELARLLGAVIVLSARRAAARTATGEQEQLDVFGQLSRQQISDRRAVLFGDNRHVRALLAGYQNQATWDGVCALMILAPGFKPLVHLGYRWSRGSAPVGGLNRNRGWCNASERPE